MIRQNAPSGLPFAVRVGGASAPTVELTELIQTLYAFLVPPLAALARGEAFSDVWTPAQRMGSRRAALPVILLPPMQPQRPHLRTRRISCRLIQSDLTRLSQNTLR